KMKKPFAILVFLFVIACSVNAGFAADAASAKAQTLLKQARTALGGEDKLASVKALTLLAEMSVPDLKNSGEGSVEISLLLPDKFARTTSQTWSHVSQEGGGLTI